MVVKLITNVPKVTNLDEEEDGRAMFLLEQPWTISIDGKLWEFAPGLKTDFASIPRIFWRIFNPTDIHLQAASFFHDQMYRCGAPRPWSDDCLRAIAEARGVGRIQSNAIWLAVRAGGAGAYSKNSDVLRLSTRSMINRNGAPLPLVGWL
jgi:hypothetical protein